MNKNLPYRPILKLPKSNMEKMMDVIGIGMFVVSILYLLLNWGNIPEEIPAHFNGAGEVDRWGSKMELIILPIIGVFLLLILALFEKAPHMHNYPNRVDESNVEQFYLNSRKMLNAIKNMCLVTFAILIVQIVRVSLGHIDGLGSWLLLVVLAILLIPIARGIYKQSKIK